MLSSVVNVSSVSTGGQRGLVPLISGRGTVMQKSTYFFDTHSDANSTFYKTESRLTGLCV